MKKHAAETNVNDDSNNRTNHHDTDAIKPNRPSSSVDPRIAAFSGALSGAFASMATHPLDVARTKLAVERTLRGGEAPLYKGTAGTLIRVFREEGVRGLFRGLTPSIISHAPAAAIFFSTYSFVRGQTRELLSKPKSNNAIATNQTSPTTSSSPPLSQSSLSSSLTSSQPSSSSSSTSSSTSPASMTDDADPEFSNLSTPSITDPVEALGSALGAGAGWTMTCLLLNPLFVLKTKQQTERAIGAGAQRKYVGLINSLRVVVAEQGVRGLYAGVVAAMAGAPGAMIQMPFYEYLKTRSLAPGERPSHARIAVSSATASCCVGIVMYPMEVVRLRLQAQGAPKRNTVTKQFKTPSPASLSATASVSASASASASSSAGAATASTEYKGIIDCFRKIFVQEGIRSFYKGIGSSIIRTVPQSAIGLSCYETILRLTTYLVEWNRM